jgi:hypothetical protein
MNWSIVIAVGFLNSASGLSQTAGGRSNLTNIMLFDLNLYQLTTTIPKVL